MQLLELGKALRPAQWIKNFFIFAPLIFSMNIRHPDLVLKAAAAFFLFCFLSGAVYLFNDLMDKEEDRHHPVKSRRPIASGRLHPSAAITTFVVISILSLAGAYFLNFAFFISVVIYLILQIGYSVRLKHMVILDVFIIAFGFFIRVIAGGLVIEVEISPWLLICTLMLALFLALSKRRHELLLLDQEADAHRPILKEYNPYLLDQMIGVVTASTLISYTLYTIAEDTIAKFGTKNLIYTVPFVLYGIFRYLYLVHQKSEGGTPESLIIRDKPLLLDVFLWVVSAVIILYFKF
jgi:4-hydroxybenzoate polyprenyltransferase